MTLEKRSRPADNGTAKDHQGAGSTPIVAADRRELIDRTRCLVVLDQDKRGRYRRRVFLTVASAERAIAHAEARGVDAFAVLCRIEPVDGGDAL